MTAADLNRLGVLRLRLAHLGRRIDEHGNERDIREADALGRVRDWVDETGTRRLVLDDGQEARLYRVVDLGFPDDSLDTKTRWEVWEAQDERREDDGA